MAAIRDRNDISGKNKRWDTLIHVAQILSEGIAELEDLLSQSKESPNLALDPGFLNKRKRSPGKYNIQMPRAGVIIPATTSIDRSRSPNSIPERNPVFETPVKKQSGAFDINPNSECHMNIKRSRFLGESTSDRSPNSILEGNQDILSKKPRGSDRSRSPNSILERCPVFQKPIKKQSGTNSKSNPRLLVEQHIVNNMQNPQPPLPEAIRGRIIETGGCLESAVVIIEKGLYPTDVNPGQCRLSVPVRQVKERFLLAGEADTLLGSKDGGNIGATLIEPCLDERQIMFGLWMSNKMYVLKGWNDVSKKYRLMAGSVIRLWAFRRNSELCFALETRHNEPIV